MFFYFFGGKQIWFVTDIGKCFIENQIASSPDNNVNDGNVLYGADALGDEVTVKKGSHSTLKYRLSEKYLGTNMVKWLCDYCNQSNDKNNPSDYIIFEVMSYHKFADIVNNTKLNFDNIIVILTDDPSLDSSDSAVFGNSAEFGEKLTVDDIIQYCLKTDNYPKKLLRYSSETQQLTSNPRQINKIVDYSDMFAFFLNNSSSVPLENESNHITKSYNNSSTTMSHVKELWHVEIKPNANVDEKTSILELFNFLLHGEEGDKSNINHSISYDESLVQGAFYKIIQTIINQRNSIDYKPLNLDFCKPQKVMIWLTNHNDFSAHDPGQKDYDTQMKQINDYFDCQINCNNIQKCIPNESVETFIKSLFIDSRFNKEITYKKEDNNHLCLTITFNILQILLKKIGLEIMSKCPDDTVEFPVNPNGQTQAKPALFFIYTVFAYFRIMWNRQDRKYDPLFDENDSLHFSCYQSKGERVYRLYRKCNSSNFSESVKRKIDKAGAKNGDAGCFISTLEYLQEFICPSDEEIKKQKTTLQGENTKTLNIIKNELLKELEKLKQENKDTTEQNAMDNCLNELQDIINSNKAINENIVQEMNNLLNNINTDDLLSKVNNNIIVYSQCLGIIDDSSKSKEITRLLSDWFPQSLRALSNNIEKYNDCIKKWESWCDSKITYFFGNEVNNESGDKVVGFMWGGGKNE